MSGEPILGGAIGGDREEEKEEREKEKEVESHEEGTEEKEGEGRRKIPRRAVPSPVTAPRRRAVVVIATTTTATTTTTTTRGGGTRGGARGRGAARGKGKGRESRSQEPYILAWRARCEEEREMDSRVVRSLVWVGEWHLRAEYERGTLSEQEKALSSQVEGWLARRGKSYIPSVGRHREGEEWRLSREREETESREEVWRRKEREWIKERERLVREQKVSSGQSGVVEKGVDHSVDWLNWYRHELERLRGEVEKAGSDRVAVACGEEQGNRGDAEEDRGAGKENEGAGGRAGGVAWEASGSNREKEKEEGRNPKAEEGGWRSG